MKYLVVQRRDATGVDSLRGLLLRRIGSGAGESTLTSQTELIDVLVDRFGLDLDDVDPGGAHGAVEEGPSGARAVGSGRTAVVAPDRARIGSAGRGSKEFFRCARPLAGAS